MSTRTRKRASDTESNGAIENISVNDYVNKCIRYIIFRSGTNEPIKKTELRKNVLMNAGTKFDDIMERVADTLDRVYGFKLVLSEDSAYVTIQNIENNTIEIHDGDDDDVPADIQKVLVMLVLTNIFMSSTPVNEASLCMFLNAVGINTDIDKGIFGKVMHFINVTMVKQNYIILQTGELLKGVSYKWGSRAESTISKHKILEFVSKIYGYKELSSWTPQYDEAKQQFDPDHIDTE